MTRGAAALFLLALAGLTVDARPSPALSVGDPRCEGLREAPQVDTPTPRFSWRLVADGRDVRQTAYQLRVTEVDGRGRPLGTPRESARLESDETQWVVAARIHAPAPHDLRLAGAGVGQPRQRQRLDRAAASSAPVSLATSGRPTGSATAAPSPSSRPVPARHFRGTFRIERLPVRARLYVSALGLVEPWLNGAEVTEDRFVPGWPDYRRRVFYAAFDVAHLLRLGDNTLGILLG